MELDTDNTRVKRVRLDEPEQQSKPLHSRIFAPYRSLGHVTTSTPFTLLQHSATFQLSTSTGHSASTYDIRKLNLLFVTSPQTPSEITSLYARGKELYVGFRNGIWIFARGKKIGELLIEDEWKSHFSIKNILGFGDWILATVGPKRICVWSQKTGEFYTSIELYGDEEIVSVFHPSTYLNKICIGKSNGTVEIWNIRTGKLVYTILPPSVEINGKSRGILTSVTPSPHYSIIALGFSNGLVHVHNIETDETLFTLASTNPITHISFRTDSVPPPTSSKHATAGPSDMMATGSSNGDITLWSLSTRRVMGVMRGVHAASTGGVVKAEFLPGQNILVTSGGDNAIKIWVFDTPTSVLPRILRQRSGHAKSPNTITFHPATHYIVSAGLDRALWGFSLRSDAQNTELSQGHAESALNKMKKAGVYDQDSDVSKLKGEVICCMAVEGNRDGAGAEWGSNELGWEGILTGGRGESFARAWSWSRRKIGRWTLATDDANEVKSVAISPCGTFGLVGSSGGAVCAYNLQSGQFRKRYPERLTKAQISARRNPSENRAGWKHTRAVTGIAVDSINKYAITCGLDGCVKFWDFNAGTLIDQLKFTNNTACTALKLHRPSNLLAVSCDDLAIRVIDLDTRRVVRELWGCNGRISDFCFSNDARWLVATSMDSVIRVWDLPTGHLIDGFKTPSIITSLSFSPDGSYLATASVDSVGIGLYTNRTLFSHVPVRRLLESEIANIALPTASGEGGTTIIDAAFEDEEMMDVGGTYNTVDQLSDKLVTMSLVPKARWMTMLNLEAIKARNKPKEAPKQPEKAPFFLTLKGKNVQSNVITGYDDVQQSVDDGMMDDVRAQNKVLQAAEMSRVNKFSLADGDGDEFARPFTKLLNHGRRTNDFSSFIAHLKSLSPSASDLEIRSLDATPPYTEMVAFITALTLHLHTRKDYELVLAWMRVFLKIHGDVLTPVDGDDDNDDEENESATIGDEETVGQDLIRLDDGDNDDEKSERENRRQGVQDLRRVLETWRDEVKRESERIKEVVGYCSGVVGFLRSGRA